MSSRVYAYLSVNGFTCAHDQVTELVGLEPRRIWRIGEHTRGGKLIEENSWSSCCPVAPNEEPPDYHVLAVLEYVANRPAPLVEFLRQHDSGINCVGEFRRINGGFHISRDLAAKCAELGLWLDFDLYNYACEDEP